MSRYDYKCELCGKEEKTICFGAVRMCRQCLKDELGEDFDLKEITKERNYEDLDDCARECGNYYNLVSLLYCIGRLTDTNMENIVETLDNIFDDIAV